MTTTYHYVDIPGTNDDEGDDDHYLSGACATGSTARSLIIAGEDGKPVVVSIPANVPTWQGEPMPEITKAEALELAPDLVEDDAGGTSLLDLAKGNNGNGKS